MVFIFRWIAFAEQLPQLFTNASDVDGGTVLGVCAKSKNTSLCIESFDSLEATDEQEMVKCVCWVKNRDHIKSQVGNDTNSRENQTLNVFPWI